MTRTTMIIALVTVVTALGCDNNGGDGNGEYSWGHQDTVGEDSPVRGQDTGIPDTAIPDTAVPDTAIPDTAIPDTTVGPDLCIPDCTGPDGLKECGDDGCGGVCGTCPGAAPNCEAGVCVPEVCTPDCEGKECGVDGCGDTCGTCPDGQGCGADGLCQCAPDCGGKICGDDGCGGSCGACAPGSTCQEGACIPDACEGCAPWQTCEGGPCQDPASMGECPFGGIAIAADCGGTVWEGCCNGDQLYYCENAENSGCPVGMNTCLCALDCFTEGATCGWSTQFMMCMEPPAQPGPDGLMCEWVGDCVPSCVGKECGSDGCGGTCGSCLAGEECQAGVCVNSTMTCLGACGGASPGGCYCDEQCEGMGDCCPDVCAACPTLSFCECIPNCAGKECGEDGCGGSCGGCPDGVACEAGLCACVPDCNEKECGDDGCGDICGTCPQVAPDCVEGLCKLPCVPQCEGAECGDDGCSGSCGECEVGFKCEEAACVVCDPQCEGPDGPKECGDDGCNGVCGECADAFATCEDGLCVACEPQCLGKQCGPDTCGGLCGACAGGTHCTAGICMADCTPDCQFNECGDDGCGGICGLCPCDGCWEKEFECSDWGSCTQPFTYTCKQIDQCTGTCDEGDDWCVQSCQSSGSFDAQDQLEAVITCLDTNGYFDCAPADEACQAAVIQDLCWSEYQGCYFGELTCSQLHDCVFDVCDEDPNCSGLCFQDATNAAQDLFMDWDECIEAQCGEDPEDACKLLAEQGPCGALLIACLYDN